MRYYIKLEKNEVEYESFSSNRIKLTFRFHFPSTWSVILVSLINMILLATYCTLVLFPRDFILISTCTKFYHYLLLYLFRL